MTAETYCQQTARVHDAGRFLLSLYLPPKLRPDLWALYAFNHEIAKTRSVVTDTQLGLIRLQWWRDALAAIYAGQRPPEHQIVQPLAEAIARHNLPQEDFETLIYAREFDVEDRMPANLDGLVHYADYTSTPLLALGLRCCGVQNFDIAAVRNVATAYALAGILRATPYHLAHHRCYLPADLVPPADALYQGQAHADIIPAVRAVREKAMSFLKDAGARRRLPKLAALHAHLAALQLAQIKSAGDDLFAARLQAPPFLREIRLAIGI